MWVCIPIVNSSIQSGSTGTRPGSAAIIEDMIDNLPGVPYIAKGKKDDSGGTKGNKVLVRRGDNSTQGYTDFTFKTSSSHIDIRKIKENLASSLSRSRRRSCRRR